MTKKILKFVILFLVGIPVFFAGIYIIQTAGELLVGVGKLSERFLKKLSAWAFSQ